MAGFNLGAFAGGIGQGVEQGQNIREKYRQMADEQVARKAQQAVDTWLQAGSQPQPAAPAPAGPPPTPVAMPGARPIGPPQPPPIAGAGMGGPPQPVPGGALPPPPPTPGPAPGGPPAASAAPGGGVPPPTPQNTDDPTQQAKVALQAIAREIAQANPGRKWGKGELLDAVDKAIGEMDKLNPIARQIAQLQLQYYKANLTSEDKGKDRDSRESIAADKLHEQAASLAERIRHEKATEATSAGRAATYAEMATYSHEDRQAAIQAANDRASAAVDSRERIAAQKDADALQRLDQALEDKDWATVAQIQAGEYKADAAATGKPTPKPAVAAPPKRGGGAPAPRSGSAPPVAGARQAPDGKWYVPDPKRPGKYLMVQ